MGDARLAMDRFWKKHYVSLTPDPRHAGPYVACPLFIKPLHRHTQHTGLCQAVVFAAVA